MVFGCCSGQRQIEGCCGGGVVGGYSFFLLSGQIGGKVLGNVQHFGAV